MWILQKNIWKEKSYSQFIDLLEKYDIKYQVVDIIPFTDELHVDIRDDEVSFHMGSIKMDRIARQRNWKTFFNDNFNYEIWSTKYHNYILNEGEIINLKNLELPLENDIFIRPILDDKTFSGTVLRAGDSLSKIQFTSEINYDMLVMTSPVKKIFVEYRGYIVDGELITCSIYKQGHNVIYLENHDEDVLNFYNRMIDIWCPSNSFVMDICRTENGFKIIEIGSIHNCGLYDANLNKLIFALDQKTNK